MLFLKALLLTKSNPVLQFNSSHMRMFKEENREYII